MIPFSVLDLAPVPQGSTPGDALRNTLDLARHAEGWGYNRYWLAEHHNMTGIASAATSVVIGQVAAATKTMRVGTDTNVPLWILGSSLFGAQLAAMLGLPYAFASHFAPGALMQALAVYREGFKPSAQLNRRHAMVGVNVFAADTDDEAKYLFTSAQQRVIGMFRGRRGQLPPPVEDIESLWSPDEKAQVGRMLACSFVGSAATVRAGLERFIADTGADELIVASAIHDHKKRLRSYEILAGIVSDMRRAAA